MILEVDKPECLIDVCVNLEGCGSYLTEFTKDFKDLGFHCLNLSIREILEVQVGLESKVLPVLLRLEEFNMKLAFLQHLTMTLSDRCCSGFFVLVLNIAIAR